MAILMPPLLCISIKQYWTSCNGCLAKNSDTIDPATIQLPICAVAALCRIWCVLLHCVTIAEHHSHATKIANAHHYPNRTMHSDHADPPRILPAALVRLYSITCIAIVALLVSCSMATQPTHASTTGSLLARSHPTITTTTQTTATTSRTLVAYVFAANDPEYETNLRYFLAHGVLADRCCDYAIILNREPTQAPLANLPPLPMGSTYIDHTNECYDLYVLFLRGCYGRGYPPPTLYTQNIVRGTIGWAVAHGHLAPQRYQYILLLNSSVRGPFVPAYWPRKLHWSRAFTSRIQGDVKLVGPTINCESYPSSDGKSMAHNPHVQTYAVAMDQVCCVGGCVTHTHANTVPPSRKNTPKTQMAYQLLQRNGSVFTCQSTLQDTVYYAEFGASRVLLDAGYNIDSLMLRYQGVDWRNRSNWDCNGKYVMVCVYEGCIVGGGPRWVCTVGVHCTCLHVQH